MAALHKSWRSHFYSNNEYKKLSLITVYVDSCTDLAESCFTSLFLWRMSSRLKKKKKKTKPHPYSQTQHVISCIILTILRKPCLDSFFEWRSKSLLVISLDVVAHQRLIFFTGYVTSHTCRSSLLLLLHNSECWGHLFVLKQVLSQDNAASHGFLRELLQSWPPSLINAHCVMLPHAILLSQTLTCWIVHISTMALLGLTINSLSVRLFEKL